MSNEIKKATESFTQHDACDDCGKRTDGLMTCTYSHDGSETKLCPDCIKDSGFCLRCGNYCAGMSSFDFSDMPGYCSDCRDEIKADFDDDEDDDGWQPCDNCDLPDACEDFGCAIKNGIRQPPEW
jgi:hypothetical protein